jgi:hypothetical protein
MKTRTIVAVLALAGVWAAGAVHVDASDPTGAYAVIDKLVLEPAEGQAQRVQIWGAFSLADTRNNDDYQAPQKGYLYYSCAPAQASTCQNEWADLKSVAGKGIGVGFGGRHMPMGRIRSATDKPEAPDAYPIRMGVVRMGSSGGQADMVQKLKAALGAR